jgi:TRAP-type C4-dicarboxylate transport system permease large subunit
MIGIYAVLVSLLLVITYFPGLSLFLPRLLLGY